MIDHYLHMTFDSGQSLQQQLRRQLVDAILQGIFPVDEPLPSCRDLSMQLGISRNTVALVYESLQDKGYLISRPRSGYYLHPDYQQPMTEYSGESYQAGSDTTASADAMSSRSLSWQHRLQQSAISLHGTLKPIDWNSFLYPFAYGQADSSLFPKRAWRLAERELLNESHLSVWTADNADRDDPELIEQLRTRVLPKRGIWARPGQILVTLGSQNALYLLARLLIGPGIRVGIENPGYRDAWNMFKLNHADISLHDVDSEGIQVDDALTGCHYVYITPSHQVPTGVTLSAKRRAQLWQMACTHDQVLIEDDYDADLNLSTRPLPAIKAADSQGRVIYLSSFSKSLAPGLRLGYMVADEDLIDELRALRRLMYRHPPLNIQRLMARFLAQGDYDAHLRHYRTVYQRKRDDLQMALHRYLDDCCYTTSEGAASFWLSAPDGIDTRKLAWAAAQRSIMIEPGESHFLDGTSRTQKHFRLGLHAIRPERIIPGIQLLSDTMARANVLQ